MLRLKSVIQGNLSIKVENNPMFGSHQYWVIVRRRMKEYKNTNKDFCKLLNARWHTEVGMASKSLAIKKNKVRNLNKLFNKD